MGAGNGSGTTAAAIPGGDHWHGNHMNPGTAFSGDSPDQRDDPADARPAEKQIKQEDARGIALIPADDRG